MDNKLFVNIFILGLAVFSTSCATPSKNTSYSARRTLFQKRAIEYIKERRRLKRNTASRGAALIRAAKQYLKTEAVPNDSLDVNKDVLQTVVSRINARADEPLISARLDYIALLSKFNNAERIIVKRKILEALLKRPDIAWDLSSWRHRHLITETLSFTWTNVFQKKVFTVDEIVKLFSGIKRFRSADGADYILNTLKLADESNPLYLALDSHSVKTSGHRLINEVVWPMIKSSSGAKESLKKHLSEAMERAFNISDTGEIIGTKGDFENDPFLTAFFDAIERNDKLYQFALKILNE